MSAEQRAETEQLGQGEPRREALSDPAQRLLLVCRSMERAKPEAQQPQAPNNPKKGGFGFGGS